MFTSASPPIGNRTATTRGQNCSQRCVVSGLLYVEVISRSQSDYTLLYLGYVSVTVTLYFGSILVTFWLHFGSIAVIIRRLPNKTTFDFGKQLS